MRQFNRVRAIGQTDAVALAGLNLEVVRPARVVREENFDCMMTGRQIDQADGRRGLACGLPVNDERIAAGRGRDFDAPVLIALALRSLGRRAEAEGQEQESDGG